MQSAKDPPTASPSAGVGGVGRRLFALGRFRFQMPRGRILDICLDGLQTFMEGAVYILGPFLIVLALAITSLLSYTFFSVILPMIMEKHAEQGSLQLAVVSLHCSFVVFLLVNILFNYGMCVMTKNDGPVYDRVVRELATVTNLVFPETPAQLLEYRRDYEDRMVIRMRRRREREEEEIRKSQASCSASSSDQPSMAANEGAVQRRAGGGATENNAASLNNKKPAPKPMPKTPSTVVRRWMMLGPYEWSYCSNSSQPKPPRSHYDHVTRKLILNLDVSTRVLLLKTTMMESRPLTNDCGSSLSTTVRGYSTRWAISTTATLSIFLSMSLSECATDRYSLSSPLCGCKTQSIPD